MALTFNFGKSVYDNGFGMFRRFLDYKLTAQGKVLVKVSKRFPSSQKCSNCNYKNEAVKDLSVREWTCPQCGEHRDRDRNVAENLRKETI